METNQEIHQIDEKMYDNVLELPMELTNTTDTYLLDLNEDCLLEIFSSNSLTIMDLCFLAETCTCFKRITQRVFPKEFTIESDNGDTYKFMSKNLSHKTEAEIGRILKNFGSCLSTYSTRGKDPVIMNEVAKYCSDGTLKQLHFRKMNFTADLVDKLESIAQSLRVLFMRDCIIHDDITFIHYNFDTLIELDVVFVKGCDEILKKTFPKLERFRFEDYKFNYRRSDVLSKFFRCHKILRRLHLDTNFVYNSDDLAHTIDQSCNELEEVILRNSELPQVRAKIGKLKFLRPIRVLDICCHKMNFNYVVTLLQALKSLEILKVINLVRRDEFSIVPLPLQTLREFHLISSRHIQRFPWIMFSQLRKLYVFDSTFETDLPYIIGHLHHLEELEIGDLLSKLSEKDFCEIVKIFEKRPNVLTLKCRMLKSCTYLRNCEQNRKVKLINLN